MLFKKMNLKFNYYFKAVLIMFINAKMLCIEQLNESFHHCIIKTD